MKNIIQFLSLALTAVLVLVACQKKAEPLPFYETGSGTDLALSTNAVNLSAANAAQNVVTFSWGDPKFATDTANYKYVVEIAPKGSDFANAHAITKIGGINGSSGITGAALNNAMVAWGLPLGTASDLDVRLISSYANNNDRKISGLHALKVTAYAVPFSLAASATGPFAPTPQTKDNILTRLTWTAPNYGTATLHYTLEYAKAGTNFAAVTGIAIATDSLQKSLTALQLFQMANITGIPFNTTGSVDVRVKATVAGTNQVSYSSIQTLRISPVQMTLYLYVPGDYQNGFPGSTGNWKPSTAPRLASSDGIHYEGFIWVPAGGTGDFKIVASNLDSYPGPNYGNGGPGKLDPTKDVNLSWPALGAHYLVTVNLVELTWKADAITTWGIIGDATPNGWISSTPLAFDVANNVWKATVLFKSGNFKFRANDDSPINLGSQGGDGTNILPLKRGGGNLGGPTVGSHVITLDLTNPLRYTYTVQ